ncbi:MAG: phosphoadenylyl-sulfate reductase [Rhizobiales bacterium]|nr:phosphoadenylyl-sulfate reductase [Hyphomicrobiales bacterium]
MSAQSNVLRAVPSPAGVPDLSELAARLSTGFALLGLPDRLRVIRDTIPGRIAFTTSFGIEDQAITHAIFDTALAVDVVTLDTGRLFPETYDVWAQTEQRYRRRIRGFSPSQERVEGFVAREGINAFRASVEARHACCHIRKVEPLRRALTGAAGWIAGLRGDQSGNRAAMRYAVVDAAHGVIKVNPLIDWTRERVVDYVRANDIPYNALHDRGFLSIGCAPCTRAVAPGEPERAGRWWWEQEDKKECGLHLDAAPDLAPQRTERALADHDA